MIIQKVGPDSVLVIAGKDELGENISYYARLALNEAGINYSGCPHCDAYTLGDEMLLFARAGNAYAYYKFACADDLIDAARQLRLAGKKCRAAILLGEGSEYIVRMERFDIILNEYAQLLDAAPNGVFITLSGDAMERLGK